VDALEERYPTFDGLNLTFEAREGILKHCSRSNAEKLEAAEPGGVGRRFLDRTQPALEAQLCNLADEIAYNAHDIDDGVRSGLLTLEQLDAVPLFARFKEQVLTDHPGLAGRRVLYEAIRRMLSAQVYDVIAATRARIADAAIASADEARHAPPLVCFSGPMQEASGTLKQFLLRNLYRHAQVVEMTARARGVVRDLFVAYTADPQEMQSGFAARPERPRAVADYIAGMTDRFAAREHERLTGRRVLP
jgi:dGTPase